MKKYVCHDAYIASTAPKAANEIIEFMKTALGSEMLPVYFAEFRMKIREMIEKANKKGKVKLELETQNVKGLYGDGVECRTLFLRKDSKSGNVYIARLHFVSVKSLWMERPLGTLAKVSFDEFDKMKDKVEGGKQ